MIVDLTRSWIRDARCQGMNSDLFFADHGYNTLETPSARVRAEWDKAKRVCRQCPVVEACARDSLGELEGVWGGLDPAERKRIRRERTENVLAAGEGPEKDEFIAMVAFLRDRLMPWGEVARTIGISVFATQQLYEIHAQRTQAASPEEEEIEHSPVAQLPKSMLHKIIQLRNEGHSLAKIGVMTGVNPRTVRRHLSLHAPHLARLAAMGAWPDALPPEGDGWVRHEGRVLHAYYLGETKGSAWFLMKTRINKEYSIAWFKAADVRITRALPRQIRARTGKASLIYGTRLSSNEAEPAAG